jgi:general secretion pathway protein K
MMRCTRQADLSLRRRGERGAALLMAMVIVTLVATMAASMVWQQWRAVQVESAERVRAQASWVLRGALDWARLVLREDARSSTNDNLTEPWAIPLAEARLSTFLASDNDNTLDDDTPDAFLSGQVLDAQAKYNLRNLVGSDGSIDAQQVEALRRLCTFIGLEPALADGIAEGLRKAALAVGAAGGGTDQNASADGSNTLSASEKAAAPLLPQTLDDLLWIGLDGATVERLRPYVTLLPDTTKVNVNTAPKEVIAAVVPDLDLARAARLVQARQRKPFNNVATDIEAVLGKGSWNFTGLEPKSDFFEVRGRLRYEDNVIEQRHLVQRRNWDVVVRQQSSFTGLDPLANSGATP